MEPQAAVSLLNTIIVLLFSAIGYSIFLFCYRVYKLNKQLKTAESRMMQVLQNRADAIRYKNGNSSNIH